MERIEKKVEYASRLKTEKYSLKEKEYLRSISNDFKQKYQCFCSSLGCVQCNAG